MGAGGPRLDLRRQPRRLRRGPGHDRAARGRPGGQCRRARRAGPGGPPAARPPARADRARRPRQGPDARHRVRLRPSTAEASSWPPSSAACSSWSAARRGPHVARPDRQRGRDGRPALRIFGEAVAEVAAEPEAPRARGRRHEHAQGRLDARRHRGPRARRRHRGDRGLHPPHLLRRRPRDHPPGPARPDPGPPDARPDLRPDGRRRRRPQARLQLAGQPRRRRPERHPAA